MRSQKSTVCYLRGEIRLPVSGSLDRFLNLTGGSLGGIGTLHLKRNQKSGALCVEVVMAN